MSYKVTGALQNGQNDDGQCKLCQSSHQLDEKIREHQCYLALFQRMQNVILNDPWLAEQNQKKDKQKVLGLNKKRADYIKILYEQNWPKKAEKRIKSYLKDVIQYEEKNWNPWIAKIIKHNIFIECYYCPQCQQQFQEEKDKAIKHMKQFCFSDQEKPQPGLKYEYVKSIYVGA